MAWIGQGFWWWASWSWLRVSRIRFGFDWSGLAELGLTSLGHWFVWSLFNLVNVGVCWVRAIWFGLSLLGLTG